MSLEKAIKGARELQAGLQAMLEECLREKEQQEKERASTGRGMPDAFADLIGLMFLHLRSLLLVESGRGLGGKYPGIGPDYRGGAGGGR
jgi:hypothetical protein